MTGDGPVGAPSNAPPSIKASWAGQWAGDLPERSAQTALGQFFDSTFVRFVAGYILLNWLARWLVAGLTRPVYGLFDLLVAWWAGPSSHYTEVGYPRAPEALLLVVVPTLIYWAFVRLSERRRVRELGGGARGLLEGAMGLGMGAGLFALIVAILAVADAYGVIGSQTWIVLQWSLPAAAVAFREELLYRGVIQRVGEERLGSWLALLLAAVWFGLAHTDNPNAGLVDGVMVALFGGGLLGAAYLATRRLWLAIGIHAAWNLVEGGVFGVPVSGFAIPGVLRSSLTGPKWLTGGGFGPEGSVVTLAVTGAAIAALLLVARRRGHLRPMRLRGRPPTGPSPLPPPPPIRPT